VRGLPVAPLFVREVSAMKHNPARLVPRYTQEWHDDQWVKAHMKDLEEFEKYFQRKRQFDKSDESERLFRLHREMMKLIGVVYFNEDNS
jgi:hypothetical protein